MPMNETIQTIVNLSKHLIQRPAEKFTIDDFIESAKLFIEITDTLVHQLELDNQSDENHNKEENQS